MTSVSNNGLHRETKIEADLRLPATLQDRAQFFTLNTVFKIATSFPDSLSQSRRTGSRGTLVTRLFKMAAALRRMLCCH